jgi:putative nucleotidyltransferase with HDIG domain
MKEEQIRQFRRWYRAYVRRYYSDDPDFQRNIMLKEDHTKRVCREIMDIAGSLSLNKGETLLAETAALFHDIGRFEQLKRYGTFSDGQSENHAVLSIRILREERALQILPPDERRLILAAVFWHNRATPPDGGVHRLRFFARLLRDADKLDIWRVITADYQRINGPRNLILEHGLPDEPRISPEALTELLCGRQVDFRHLRTRNDFKLMHMSWIFDIFFPRAFQAVLERGYLEIIRDSLPDREEITRAYEQARRHAERRALSGPQADPS